MSAYAIVAMVERDGRAWDVTIDCDGDLALDGYTACASDADGEWIDKGFDTPGAALDAAIGAIEKGEVAHGG